MAKHKLLTPRQWALYNFLKEQGDVWTKQIDIAYALKNFYDCSFENDKFHDSKARLQITMDIRAISDSDVIQKIIISSPQGIKIANETEFDSYIRRELGAVIRRLNRVKRKAEKARLNGQTRVVFKGERDTIEAFIEESPKRLTSKSRIF